MDDNLYEPLEYYDNQLRQIHEDNADEYFQNLVKESGIDINENEETVKKYNKEQSHLDKLNKKLNLYKTIRIFLTILAIVGGIMTIYAIYICAAENALNAENRTLAIILLVAGPILLIVGLALIFAKVNKLIKGLSEKVAVKQKEVNGLLKKAYEQMAPLNNLFSDWDVFNIIEKTIPDMKFNKFYSKNNETELIKRFNYVDIFDEKTSVLDTLSGKFCGNPFVYMRCKKQYWDNVLYTGAITITWQESYTDSEGNVHFRTRSQVLTASVNKPKPFYRTDTYLGYGNQTAADLKFSRVATHSERLTEKQIERKIKSGKKELEKKSRKETQNGGSFQELANSEFDVLFGALDRDNEVQFRTMFTPLAQVNMVKAIKSTKLFGDDFDFYKMGRYNVLQTEHSQFWNMETSPELYYSYSVKIAEKKFKDINRSYFKSVYGDFLPIMSIPAYMDEPSFSLEPIDDYNVNYTDFEYESLANSLGEKYFEPQNAATESILKSDFIQKNDSEDEVNITAHSFSAREMVDFIPVLGGDGNFHEVPVPWTLFEAIENIRKIKVDEAKNKNSENENIVTYLHNLYAELI